MPIWSATADTSYVIFGRRTDAVFICVVPVLHENTDHIVTLLFKQRAVTDESTPPLIPDNTCFRLSLMVGLPSIRLFTIEGRVCLTIEGRLSSIHYNTLG